VTLWSLAALAVFAATRAVILLAFGPFVTDLPMYQTVGFAAKAGLQAYCDQGFPYPPLALPFVDLPALAISDPNRYNGAFKTEMLIVDFICYLGVWAFLRRRLRCDQRTTTLALAFYCVLGIGLPHLLFERLDIAMTAIFIWSLYFFTNNREWGRVAAYLLLLAGALIKLFPLFIVPLFMILEVFTDDGQRWPKGSRAARPVFWVVGLFGTAILLYAAFVCRRLIPELSQHGSRGIQIESTWALPLIYLKIFQDWKIEVEYVYGAFHIVNTGVPPTYLFLSKYLGFAALLAFYDFLARRFRRCLVITGRLKPQEIMYLFYVTVLIIIVTQRVLSPQYVMWLMPLACVQMVEARHKWAVAVGAGSVFGLTYVVFDLGFYPILQFHPWYSLALLARNLALVAWTADLLRRVLRTLRLQRVAAISGT
jgi:hypothetical protein